MAKNVKRLYEQFKPEHYALDIRPDREAMTFTGSVTITGHKTGRPSQRLTFHQKDLTITEATVIRHDKKGDQVAEIDRINHHAQYDEVRLHAQHLLYPGKYTVTLKFKGKITRPMNGIYPCFFTHDKKDKQLIATQFESHHAREAFPCIDEPEAKATFDLTLTTPVKEAVLANTPVKSQKKHGALVTTTFETTPKMSTYLLAFVYGEMDYLEAKTKSGVTVRTYATPDNTKFTEFALDVAVRCLDFYNDYFGIPYPLEKCDMVALPDFASGAMENWGLVTYREQTLLVDPANTSLSVKQYVAMVIAHELAHQWFGNLVTMRWWTDLWLNEGFASWIEYMAVDHLFPDWEMWTQFIADEQQQALKLDALKHTHPVEVPVRHPDEIRSIFDTISYAKGASVIHMLYGYLGEKDFQAGLRHYLKTHAYGNTDTIDLWEALEKVSKKPVKSFMHAWTAQAGYPVVSAEVADDKVKLHQQRFFLNPKEAAKKHNDTWPIALLTGIDKAPDILDKSQGHLEIPDANSFKLNRGQSGFYRAIYDSAHLARLAALIRAGEMPPLDRLGILSDTFEAAKAGHLSTRDALQLLEAYAEEDNAAVWDIIASCIGSLRVAMDDEDLREAMKPYIRKLTNKQVTRLGWDEKEGESHFDKLLRPTVLGMSAAADEPAIVEESIRRFNAMKQPEDIHPDIRGIIYGTAVRHGGKTEFDKLLALHNTTTNSEERLTIAGALTGFKQPSLIKRALGIIDSKDVRLQDVSYWIAYSFSNRWAKHDTWEWMTKHWAWLEKNLGSDMSFSRMPLYAARNFSDLSFLKEYKKFFEPKVTPALERPYNQGIEIIEWQSDWKSRDFETIKQYFESYS